MASRPGRGTGRPPLTEEYRHATRMEIADHAVRLFVTQGVAATTAEDIASAAGVSTRTLWRYFRSKEDCARPLITAGLDMMTERLRDYWRGNSSLTQAMPGAGDPELSATRRLGALRDLVRLARDEPGLRAIWLETHLEAEAVFASMLARGAGRAEDDLAVRLQAGMLNAALRIVVQDWATDPGPPDGSSIGDALARALQSMTLLFDSEIAARSAGPVDGVRPG